MSLICLMNFLGNEFGYLLAGDIKWIIEGGIYLRVFQFCALDILGWVIFSRGSLVHCRMFGSIPGLNH